MVFQHFLKTKGSEEKGDIFDQLKFIVTTLLKREIPSNGQMHQIILNTNKKIQELTTTASYHRKHMNMYTSVGTFHKEAHEHTLKDLNQLQLLLDHFILLNIDEERDQINHRLRFHNQKIESIYNEITEYRKRSVHFTLEEKFWKAIKEDLMPILAELR
mgnify:FL=1